MTSQSSFSDLLSSCMGYLIRCKLPRLSLDVGGREGGREREGEASGDGESGILHTGNERTSEHEGGGGA